jgi:hypothetical protein
VKESTKTIPSPIRLPQELKDWLKHKAVDNRRSFSKEVLVRLEKSRELEQTPQGATA